MADTDNNSSDCYEKNKGFATEEGIRYQVNLSAVFLLNALKNQGESGWKMSVENEKAGKFDDVVLEFSDNSAVLLQAKHKKNKIITFNDLLTTKNDDFSLAKYFVSYEDIKDKFTVKDVMLCTNTDVQAEEFLTHHTISRDSTLYYGDAEYSFYTFNGNVLPHLKQGIEKYYKQINSVATISDDKLNDFLIHFHLYANYPKRSNFREIIENSLTTLKRRNKLCGETSYQSIYSKLNEWYHKPRGEYMTGIHANALFCKITSDNFYELLEKYEIFFENNVFLFNDTNERRMFHVIADDGYLLQAIKICRTFQSKSKILCVSPQHDIEIQKKIVDAFEMPQYSYLLIIPPKVTTDYTIREINSRLIDILKKHANKKVILVAERNNKLVQQISLQKDVCIINKPIKLEDLAQDARISILTKKNIVFQGRDINLEELLENQTSEQTLDLEILEKLIKNERITIGSEVKCLDEDVERYYICRSFYRELPGQYEEYEEGNIFEVDEKMILIADNAGMGKTIILAKLAEDIKKANPHLWVIRIELNLYTKFLRESLRKNKTSIDIFELLNSVDATKLKNKLETVTFLTHKKVVLLLDGVDEISPDYTELVLKLLLQCSEAPNFAKIFITTRPHMVKTLKKTLHVTTFILQPFTEQNQIDFLTSYWMHNLELSEEDRSKVSQYAESLIGKMFAWTGFYKVRDRFAAVPLQLRMLAEIFQENNYLDEDWEGCKESLSREGTKIKLPHQMNITKLYEMFIEKEKEVFVDKGNPSGNPAANESLLEQFQNCLDYHRVLALQLILDKSKCDFFSCCQNSCEKLSKNMLKIGIVQKSEDTFNFVHRTFAEYFVAESLIRELQLQNQNVEFQRFFIDEVLVDDKFNVIRTFVNGFVHKYMDSLPQNVFEKYQSSRFEKQNPDLIHTLAEKGYGGILQLILKCIDFKIIRNTEIDITELLDAFEVDGHVLNLRSIFNNTLSLLQFYVRQGGINIKDDEGNTPLHKAGSTAVPFLLKIGANINGKNKSGDTPLHLSTMSGKYEVIELLVEHGAYLNIKNEDGNTPLHYASTLFFPFEIINLFVKHGADVNIKDKNDFTPLHFASIFPRFESIKILVEHGANVTLKNKHGNTPLHYACRFAGFESIKALVEGGGDVNAKDNNGDTPLHLASKWAYFKTTKLLVEHGGDVNLQNKDRATSLHNASIWAKFETIKLLVEHGGNVNIKDNDDSTPLHFASRWAPFETMKLLVEHGGNVNLKNKDGSTPLHYASEWAGFETIKLLMEHGGDVNIKDKNDCIPLQFASRWAPFETIKLLAKSGGDINLKDSNGDMPLHNVSK